MLQGTRATAFINPLLHSIMEYAKEKAAKDLKSPNNQRTLRPPVPGRGVMSLLRTLGKNIESVAVGNMIMTVTIIAEFSFMDGMFGTRISEFDFREEGFGIVKLHGPVTFKWEMCVSEQGQGPVEGILSMTFGGWTSTDRFGLEVVKQCFDPRLAKKRSLSGESVKQVRGAGLSGKVPARGGIFPVEPAGKENYCAMDSRKDEGAGIAASTKGKGVRYNNQDRTARYLRRSGEWSPISVDNTLPAPDNNEDEISLNIEAAQIAEERLNIEAVEEPEMRSGEL